MDDNNYDSNGYAHPSYEPVRNDSTYRGVVEERDRGYDERHQPWRQDDEISPYTK